MDDYLREFVQESEENITELNNALLELERNPDDEETMDRVFRMAHTLKGNCGAMGFDDASDLAHAIEDRLEDVRAGRLDPSPELMDTVFQGVDALEASVAEVRQHGEPRRDVTGEIAELRALGPEQELVPPGDDDIEEAVAAAEAPGPDHEAYHVRLDVEAAAGLNNAALVVEALEDAFDLLGTVPPETDLRAGDHDGQFDAVFGSAVGERAIEGALDPVDEVQAALITEVTDRAAAAAVNDDDDGDAAGAADDLLADAGSGVDAAAAADMEVDELLDEFDEYDDLDALVEQMDDPGDIGEIGDAGSFDDLDIEADDVDAPDPLAEEEPTADAAGGEEIDLESGGGAFGDDDGAETAESADATAAAADTAADSGASETDDEEVEDAAETFAELKEEVDPVGFDELQTELDDLEFDQYDQEEEVGFDELLTDEELEGEEFGGMAGADEEQIDEAIDDILVDDAGVADHEATADEAAAGGATTSDVADEAAEADPPGFEDADDGDVATDDIAFGDDGDVGDEITFGDADADDTAADESATADADATLDETAESVDFGEFASGPDDASGDAGAAAEPDASADEGTFADEVFPDAEETADAAADAEPAEPEPADAEPVVSPTDGDPTPAVEPAPEEVVETTETPAEPAVAPGDDPTPAVEPAPETGDATPAVTPTEGDPTPAVEAASEPAAASADGDAEPAAEPTITPADDPISAVEPVAADEPATPERPAEPATAEGDADDGTEADASASAAAGADAVDVDFDVGDDGFGDEELDVSFDDEPASPATPGDETGDPATAEADGETDEFVADTGAADLTADADDVDEDFGADPDVDLGVDESVDVGDGEADVEVAEADDVDAADAVDERAPADDFGDFGAESTADLDADFETDVDDDLGADVASAGDLDDAAFDDDEEFDEIRFADADTEADASAGVDVATDAVGSGADDVDVDEIAGTGLDEGSLGGGTEVDDDALDLGRESPLSGFDSGFGDAQTAETDAEAVEDSGPDYPDRDVDLDELLPIPPREVAAEGEDGEMASIRVDIDQLDDLMNLVEGLVTQRARLRRAVESGESLATIDQELDDVEELTGELQDTVMDIRLVPLRSTANRLPRIVRDVAREQGKQVEFEMSGADVELDRSVLDDISDPLMHIVRNAVDHGIEHPEDREAADKDPTGAVELRAERQRDTIVIEVEDDGRGLDPDELRNSAVEEGILTNSEAAALSDEDAYDLIFNAGFSTATEVTDVSGRGVGMDVVANAVAELDGEVDVESERGEGTTVRLRLPVSVAISDVLFVEAGGEEYGIPLKTVEEIDRMGGVETEDGEEFVAVGDERFKIVRLADRLDAPEPGAEAGGMLVRLRTGVRTIALHCDEVRGQQEVVVKPFEGVLGDVPGLTGAAVLGEGEVVNILDVNTL
jgi:two-component system chemotaxis sensor kinase CheA